MLRALRSLSRKSDHFRHVYGSLESVSSTSPRAWYSVSNRETQAQTSPLYAHRGVLRLAGGDLYEYLQVDAIAISIQSFDFESALFLSGVAYVADAGHDHK